MIRRSLLCLLALTLTSLAFAADDPPTEPEDKPDLIIKKKKKPADDVKPKEADPKEKPKLKLEPRDDLPGDGPREGVDAKAIMERINKNIRESEQRLQKRDPGDTTRQVQRDIVKDLNSLIEQAQQPPPPGSAGAAGNPDNKDPQSQPGKQGEQGQQQASRSKRSERNKMGQATQAGHSTGGAGNDNPSNAPDRRIDVSQGRGPSLPEMARQEMDAYLREEFAVKYSELLKQYYQNIAEKSRRTEDKR